MLIVRTTTPSGSSERSCSHRRVSTSQIGVSSEFSTTMPDAELIQTYRDAGGAGKPAQGG